MRAWRRITWPAAGSGRPGRHRGRTGVTVGRAQLTGLAEDLAAWTDDFYEQRARDADDASRTGTCDDAGRRQGHRLRPEHRKSAGKETSAHPGIKKMAEIVAVADFTPASASRRTSRPARPPQGASRPRRAGQVGSASITESIEDMIAAAYDEADRRDPGTGPPAGLPRRRQQAADRRHRGPGRRTRAEGTGPDRLHPRQRLPRQGRRRPAPRRPGAQASGPTGSSSASCTAARRPSPPPSPPSPRRPAPTPASATSTSPTWTGPSPTSTTTTAHALRQGLERLADRHRHDRGSLQIRHRRQIRHYRREMVPTVPRHPQAPRRRRQRRPRRLHDYYKNATATSTTSRYDPASIELPPADENEGITHRVRRIGTADNCDSHERSPAHCGTLSRQRRYTATRQIAMPTGISPV